LLYLKIAKICPCHANPDLTSLTFCITSSFGIERRNIFADDTDKERFVARLSMLLTKSGTKCFAWSLLSNHLHLLLMPTPVHWQRSCVAC